MNRSHKLEQALERMRGDLAGDPEALRAFALELLCDRGRAHASLWYECGVVDEQPRVVRWRAHGAAGRAATDLEHGRTPCSNAPLQWQVPARRMHRRFAALHLEGADGRAHARPADTDGPRHCAHARLLVVRDRVLVASVDVLRAPGAAPFDRADLTRLNQCADAVADALLAARDHEAASRSTEACDVLLEPGGEVDGASGAGSRLLLTAGVHEALARAVQAVHAADRTHHAPHARLVVEGHCARFSRLHGRGRVRYLARLEPVPAVPVHPGFELSPTQRAIARLACSGANGRHIAHELGVSVETVRSHLRHAYRALGLRNRAAFVRLLDGMPPDAEPPEAP